MKDHVRAGLLERIERDGATVGASIPEELTVGDRRLALRSFVHEASDGARDGDAVQEVVIGLRTERKRRRDRLETADLSREAAEDLAESILGIDRALSALESTGETDIEAEIERKEQADQKRWRSFLKKVSGEESTRGGSR